VEETDYPLDQRVLRRHPQPNPPPQAGEGANEAANDPLTVHLVQ